MPDDTDVLWGLLPPRTALVVTVGFPPGYPVEAPARAEVVDLDTVDPGAALTVARPGAVAVIARTYTDLRRAASLGALLPKSRYVVIGVAVSPPEPAVRLPEGLPDWHAARDIQARRGPSGEWALAARFASPVPSGGLLAAVVRRNPLRRPVPPVQRVALAGPGAAHWRPGDTGAVPASMAGPLGEATEFLPADMVIRMVRPDPVAWTDGRVRVVDRPHADRLSWVSLSRPGALRAFGDGTPLLDPDSVPPVDEGSVNPAGFVASPALGTAELGQTGDHWTIQGHGIERIAVPPSGAVTCAEVARLRQVRTLEINWGRHTGPLAAVRTIAGLAAAGVPMRSAGVPAWAGALGDELIGLITGVGTDELADDIRREVHSIRLRRAALRGHSTRARWRNLAALAGLTPAPEPTVSVLLCTKRPGYVRFALQQIARQRHVDLEVVMALHGCSRDLPAVQRLAAGFPRPITVVHVDADVPFGEALNRGAVAASGSLLTKWDDDDWYGPEHLSDLLLAREYSGADLVGCARFLIYLEQHDLTVYRPQGQSECFDRPVAGGTLMIDRQSFVELGGFRPLPRGEDSALFSAVTAAGGHYYRTHGLGYVRHRRESGHTWEYPADHFRHNATREWPGFVPGALVEADEVAHARR